MTKRALFLIGLCTLTASAGWARQLPTPAPMAAERDALIDKIARGEDYEASVARFDVLQRELLAQRDAATQAEQKVERDRKEQLEQKQTLDYLVSEHCFLRADPSKPADIRTGDLLHADWGKVVRKQAVEFKGKNAFAPTEPGFVYLVKGGERTYSLSSQGPSLYLGKKLRAEVGDLVLLCWTGLSTHGSDGAIPAEFTDNVISQGFAARLAAPPRIADKARWNPLHLTGESALRMAIERVHWAYPEDRPVVSLIHVLADLGSGQFEIAAQRQSYVLTVPSGLKNRELVQPGKYLWAIMSTPVFDLRIKKLVMRAEDLEAHYVQPLD